MARQLQAAIRHRCGDNAAIEDLLGDRYQSIIDDIVISCATDPELYQQLLAS